MSVSSAAKPLSVTADTQAAGSTQPLEQLLGHDYLQPLKALQHALLLEGRSVVDLSMVNPDLTPPRVVLDRLLEWVTKPSHHRYAVSRGIRRLREAFCSKYSKRFGVDLNPETEVCVCLGSKDATFQTLRYVVQFGDSVVVGAPAYPAHLSAVSLVGGRYVPWIYPHDPEAAAESLGQLIRSCSPKALVLNLPANPTGAVVHADWWKAVGKVCQSFNVTVVNDFVYGEMCFSGDAAPSALVSRSSGARCVEVYSLSKAYNVPGWRVGAILGDPEIVRGVSRLKAHSDYGLFLPLQYAAAVALTATEDIVRPTTTTYERRLRTLAVGLKGLGWEIVEPGAGASLWCRYPRYLQAACDRRSESCSVEVAERLLREASVLVTPGVVFGPQFDDFVRFAAVAPEERMRDVISALRKLMPKEGIQS
jgi:alanine-synthesizing transaminase